MKYVIFASAFLLMSLQAFAINYKTQVHSIEKGNGREPYLVKFTDGHVAFVRSSDRAMIESLRDSVVREEWLDVKLDNDLNLKGVQSTYNPGPAADGEVNFAPKAIDYDPSVVSSSTASSVFKRMKRGWQNESQCYNRAHIWTYEEYKRSNLQSMKLFLFFTSRYIRNYRYHWWFHVSPMVYVGGTDNSNMRVLDKRYTGGPLRTKTWTDIFMRSKRSCPIVYKYSSYRNHQQSEDCYLIPTTMYFWQPRDIDRYERTGSQKTSYIQSEISHAYWEAF